MNYKLAYIDTLRGIAILMVIAVHTSKSLNSMSPQMEILMQYGQMGVQLFFVVSAFTLLLSMKRHQKEKYKLSDFFIRRFFRIAPMYYFGIILYFLFKTLKNYLQTGNIFILEQYTINNILANISFIHGFIPAANNNIVPGGWSIGTEMAFYLLFPFLFYIVEKIYRLERGIFKVFIFLLILIMCLYSIEIWLVIFKQVDISNNSFLYFNLINQLPVFLVGIYLYYLDKDSLLPIRGNLPFFVIVTIIAVVLSVWDAKFVYMFIPLIAALSFIFLFIVIKNSEYINFKFLQRIGQLSFSMYILHFIFALEVSHQIEKILRPLVPQSFILILLFIFTVGSTYILALVTEKYIEKPGQKFGKNLIRIIEKKERNAT